MPPKVIPPRIWVILAREAHKAVIIRRGPTDWTRLSLWDTDTDQVDHGQWLHARLYPERCDLSPDGSLFVYFAFHDNRANWHPEKGGFTNIYTAISRPPYFTALALWNAFDTWGGGGMFADNTSVWINGGTAETTHPKFPLPKALKIADYKTLSQEDVTYRSFSGAHGWKPSSGETNRMRLNQQWQQDKPYEFYRESPNGKYRLERTWYLGYWEKQRRYSLYTVKKHGAEGDPILINGDLTWADWDHNGRLVIANKGAIYALDPDNPNGERTLITDLNGQEFEEVIAPDWARRW